MAKYRVWAKSISHVYIDVEAKNKEQAREIAEEVDGGDFRYYDGEWEFSDIDEADDMIDRVDYTYEDIFGEE